MRLALFLALAAAAVPNDLLEENNAPGFDKTKSVSAIKGKKFLFVALTDEATRDLLETHIRTHPEIYGDNTTTMYRIVTTKDELSHFWYHAFEYLDNTFLEDLWESIQELCTSQMITWGFLFTAAFLWNNGRRLFARPGAAPRRLLHPFILLAPDSRFDA